MLFFSAVPGHRGGAGHICGGLGFVHPCVGDGIPDVPHSTVTDAAGGESKPSPYGVRRKIRQTGGHIGPPLRRCNLCIIKSNTADFPSKSLLIFYILLTLSGNTHIIIGIENTTLNRMWIYEQKSSCY